MQGGLLKSSQGVTQRPYLPKANDNSCRDQDAKVKCFAAGEGRTNENLGLLGIQTLFMREHNRIASELAQINPFWNDERLFREARRITIAEYQHVIYNEYLPAVLGFNVAAMFDITPLPGDQYHTGYNPDVILNIFNP